MKTRLFSAKPASAWLFLLMQCVYAMMFSGVSPAQWSINPKANTPVCTAPLDQYLPQMISDGAHGAIIVWQDTRNGNTDIYAQRLDSTGVPRWVANGVPVCTATGNQFNPVVASDSLGGAVIAWLDNRSTPTEIYVQRLNPSGVSLWTLNGQRIASPVTTTGYSEVAIAGDGRGGAILAVTYLFNSAGGDWDVWSYRVDSSGVVGPLIVVSNSGGTREYQPTIAGDGTGGAVICFRSTPVNTFGPGSLYAARLNPAGTVVWGAQSTKAICTAANDRTGHVIAGDRANGAIVAWADQRTGATDPFKMYAQRIDSSGNVGWATNGVLMTSPGNVTAPRILSDGAGGALAVWDDQQASSDYHAYAGRLDNNGQPQASQRICVVATGSQFLGSMASDGVGGAIVTWYDTRVNTNLDIYAQRVNSAGAPQWATAGVPICTALYNQAVPVVVSDGTGGGIFAWYDFRTNGANADIYAQRVSSNGLLGIPQKRVAASIVFPAAPAASTEYRLFGAPGDLTSVAALKPSDFVSGNAGPDWRMFRDNGAASNFLQELSGASPLASGEGYWLLQKGTLNINRVVTLPVLDTAGTYAIPLHAGWNIITNPFDAPVSWATVGGMNHHIDTVAAATAHSYSGSYAASATLAPFTGYYFFNDPAYGLTSSLAIPYPLTDAPQLAKVTSAPVTWQLQLVLRSDINIDSENYLGISPAASPGRDMMDAHKPPLFLDQGFLYFPHPEWDRVYSRFSSDFRPSLGEGQVWTFEVSNPRKSDGTIQIQGMEHVPPGCKVVLINADNSVPVDLRSNSTYRFKSTSSTMTFKLIVGKEGFVDDKIAETVPKTFALNQNYPNPFNPSTSVQIDVPRPARVRVDVYSILGQLVTTLMDDQIDAGVHTVQWDSKNRAGQQVSSGVYLCRMLVDGRLLQTKKMVLEK